MTIQDLHETMYTLIASTYIQVKNVEGAKVLYLGNLCDLPFALYQKAKVYGFNPASCPMTFFVKED